MAVSTPPRLPEILPNDSDLLEALIEEARRRARRRRRLYGLAGLAAVGIGAAALFGFGDRGGGGRPAEQAPPPGAPALPAPRQVTATNGQLTILAGDAIANLLPSGELRTVVLCERMRNPLCAAHPYSLDWAPDGRRLAYATAIGPGAAAMEWKYVALHVLDTRTRRHISRRVPCFADSIDWSPDGARLAYVCGGRIYLIASDLSKPARLLRTGMPGAHLASPSWGPDGRRITFTAGPRGRASDTAPGIYVAFTAPTAPEPPVLLARGWLPAWSPDGTRIAYRAGCGGIKLVTPSGRDLTPASVVLRCSAIGVGGRPVWSPDGQKIAVSRGWPTNCPPPIDMPWNQSHAVSCRTKPGIYVMNADGTDVRFVSEETSRNFGGGGSIAWRPQPASG
jgi:hypothetical protein